MGNLSSRAVRSLIYSILLTFACATAHAESVTIFLRAESASGKAALQLNTSKLTSSQIGDILIFNGPGISPAGFVLDRVDSGLGGSVNLLGHSDGDQRPSRLFVLSFADEHVNAIVDLPDGSRVTVAGTSAALRMDHNPAGDSRRVYPRDDGIGMERKVGDVRVPADLNPPSYGGMATIDVVVAMSPEFEKDHYNEGPVARVNALMSVANRAFLASGISVRLSLVGFTTVAADANKTSEQMLYDITGKDAKLTKAFSVLRETKNADIVIYVRKYLPSHQGVCGSAYIGGYRRNSTEAPIDLSGEAEKGYAVVHDGKLPDGRYCHEETLAHEVGHNLGSKHDHVEDWGDERGAYDENFAHIGYGAQGGFTTIMGYPKGDHSLYVSFFSAPNLSCNGVPCGSEDGDLVADNARRFSDVRFKVAGWRGPKYSELLVDVSGSGDGQVTAEGLNCGYLCRAQYPSDRYVELQAMPVAGSTFAGWSVPCSPQPAAPATTCLVSMSQARKVTATFISKEAYARLTVLPPDKTLGSVTGDKIDCGDRCSVRFKTETPITLKANPRAGKRFVGWTGACEGQKITCVLRLTADAVVGVKFVGRKVVSLSAASRTAYAVLDDGSLWAWGDNSSGQFGNGNISEGSSRPIHVGDGYQVVSAGDGFAFGLKPSGELFAWGRNDSGQLGDGSTQRRLSATKIGSDFLIVSSGLDHTLAIRKDGRTWSWGKNLEGQLGDNSQTPRNSPAPIPAQFSSVSAYANTSFGVTKEGVLFGWGENRGSELGDGSNSPFQKSPVQIATDIIMVQAGFGRSVAINKDRALLGWGNNNLEQLDNGQTDPPMPPADVWRRPVVMGKGYAFATVAAAFLGSAIRSDGRWELWGRGLGDATPPMAPRPPTQFPGHFSSTVCGGDFCLARSSSGSVWAIGRNEYGQLGNGGKQDQWRAVQVFLVE